ncbi:hypothetical protein PHYPO_G00222210 [Pangasianodon hypophthalmus]|uniref:Uncharacterized protein n=1 Tax=Pangasianodon hypophthalmus TaxID=310915 RepID=A0A5N5NW87_PANHP|nr:hypothetical protein PHYPO_G00222210 [Pangasianodon hypophthalmus]
MCLFLKWGMQHFLSSNPICGVWVYGTKVLLCRICCYSYYKHDYQWTIRRLSRNVILLKDTSIATNKNFTSVALNWDLIVESVIP